MMECPVCGYDNMDVIAEDGFVKYECPVCREFIETETEREDKMSVSNHDFKVQFNARFEAEKEARKWQAKYDSLLKRVREEIDALQYKSDQYQLEIDNGSPEEWREIHRRLQAEIKTTIDNLIKHLPELEEK